MAARLAFLDQSSPVVARRLLGCLLHRTVDGAVLTLRIVETEAYDQTDAASHSFRGPTERTAVMFGPSGRLYVYFTYGLHYCANIVTGPVGRGAAVLLRAGEPLAGVDQMASYRNDQTGLNLANGPAKLCQALLIDRGLNGHDLHVPPLILEPRPRLGPDDIVTSTRIGITRAREVPWRFYLKGSPYVSHR